LQKKHNIAMTIKYSMRFVKDSHRRPALDGLVYAKWGSASQLILYMKLLIV